MKKNYRVVRFGGVVLLLCIATALVFAQAPDTLWTRTYGGADIDRGDCVQQTSDGGYIIVGSTASFGIYVDIYLIKTDSLGNTIWTQTYGDSGCDYGHSVKQTIEGGYVIVGSRWDTTGGYEDLAYLIKTNSDGDTLWTRTFFDAGAQSVQQTNDDGYIFTGQLGGDLYLIKTDSIGSTLWVKIYGGNDIDQGMDVRQTFDNGYIVVGSTHSFGAGHYDVWLLKMEPDVGIEEKRVTLFKNNDFGATIFNGPLLLPEDKKCKIFDITGRVVAPTNITRGIYFIEVDGVVTQKVVKVR